MKKIVGILSLILITFLLSRYVFEPTNLYYELPWLDVPMHILGGYLIVSLLVAFFGYKKQTLPMKFFIIGLFTVMIIWEIYEYGRGVVLYDEMTDYIDSIKDIIFGFLGGFLAYKRK